MGKKFICEVKKDNINNKLKLIDADHYSMSKTSDSSIDFSNHHEMNKYFNKYCISEDQLNNNSNNLFMFLFFTLLFIFLIVLMCQTFNKQATTITNTSFGRFSF